MALPLSSPSPQQRLPALVAEGVCVIALLLACVKLGRGVEGVLDLGLWDEADYLYRALLIPERGLPDAEWGPLYSLWYLGLSRLWPDPVEAFYANTRLLLLLTSVAGYAFLRRVGARPWLALAGASLYLLSMAPHVLPRPTLLALFVIVTALLLAFAARTKEEACVRVGLGLLVASFARPEYFLSFLLASGVLGALLIRGVAKERTRGPWAVRTGAAYALGVLALMAVLGNPLGNTRNRRFFAFCQHFADNYVRRTGLPVSPWGQCETVIQSVFGDVDSLGDAARANPGEFLAHLWQNVRRYPLESLRMFAASHGGELPLPGRRPWTREQAGHLGLIAVAVGFPLARLIRNGRRIPRALRSRRVSATLAAAFVVLLPVLVTVALIQPRHHYLVMQGLMGLAVLAALASAAWTPRRSDALLNMSLGPRPTGLVLAAMVAGVLVLSVPDLVQRQGGLTAVKKEQLLRVYALRALGLPSRIEPGGTINVLDAQGGLSVYLGPPFRRIPTWTKHTWEPLASFLRRQRVDLVILDEGLRQDPLLSADPALEDFLSEPGAFGYVTWRIPGVDLLFAVPQSWTSRDTRYPAVSRPSPRR
ncbi:hypothetical protein JY651_15720 [Pyxidicoccus parkwayensis]|uniref:Glycosyltransferase RgtA/B/C/D-like domain-containing protein n=1 Tax=Pyxidicoccus parkwayensis TaxID=2813578 RepID=A0ABX7P747_9BACT|nr:hypothetical protein [Pyxidicoccus parkwaysis]QSQ26287.1 hypothetical protein JY651_15720 [Pyxidicoccus parkwaysis]